MEPFASSGGSIVVPAQLVCGGILLYASITSAVLGIRRASLAVYLSFAALCLAAAAVALATAGYYLAGSLSGGLAALRWVGAGEAAMLAALLAFVGYYSRARNFRPWVAAAATAAVIGVAAHALAPQGMRFSRIESSGWVPFSWGEAIFYVQGTPSVWTWAFYAALAAVLAWSMWRVEILRRRGRPDEAVFLAGCMAPVALAGAYGALVDFGAVRSFYAISFAMAAMAVLMGFNLLARIGEQHASLERTAEALRREIEELREAEAQLRLRAFSDPVTGLPNRMFVHDHLTGLIEHGPPQAYGAVLSCVLAHYESGDRAISRAFVDELMREVTVRLAETVRGRAVIARTGGDAFTAVLDSFSESEDAAGRRAEALSRDIAAALSHAFRIGEYSLFVFATVGLATFATRESSAVEVLSRAEKAQQQARALAPVTAHGHALLRQGRGEDGRAA